MLQLSVLGVSTLVGASETLETGNFTIDGQSTQSTPMISVVVPVRNEAVFIAATLGQLLSQDYPQERYEVIVADGRSTDSTCKIVEELQKEHSNLRLVDNPKRRSSAGRNAGIQIATGEMILIVDGHCRIDNRNHLRHLAEAFSRSDIDCVGRPQPLDVEGAGPLQQTIAAARDCWLGHHSSSYIYATEEQLVPPDSVAVAYRREVFEKVGPFDESFDACEDVELNHRVARAGMKCLFTPKAMVHYYPRNSLAALFRQLSRYGRGRVRLMRKHTDTFSVASFLPAMFAVGILLGIPLAWLWPDFRLVYAGILAIYAFTVVTTSLMVAVKSRRMLLLPRLPFVFMTIHAAAAAGVLSELVAGKRKSWRSAEDEKRLTGVYEKAG